MPLDHPSEFTNANIFTAQPDPYIWLIEVLSPSGGPILSEGGLPSTIRVTPNATPVTFSGKTYQPFPVTIGELRRDESGGAGPINLSFSSASPDVIRIVEANDHFRDHQVKMLLVHSAFLGTPSSKVTIPGTVTDVNASWNSITLIVSAYNDLIFDVPQRLLTRRCPLVYRGLGCDFVGDQGPPINAILGDCAKTLAACIARGVQEGVEGLQVNHPLNFGGHEALSVGVFS